jgi:hypothetical protein
MLPKEEVSLHNFYWMSNITLGTFGEMVHLRCGLDQIDLTNSKANMSPHILEGK